MDFHWSIPPTTAVFCWRGTVGIPAFNTNIHFIFEQRQLHSIRVHWIKQHVLLGCLLFRFLSKRHISKISRFDRFLIGGWFTVRSAGDVSRLANPTLLC